MKSWIRAHPGTCHSFNQSTSFYMIHFTSCYKNLDTHTVNKFSSSNNVLSIIVSSMAMYRSLLQRLKLTNDKLIITLIPVLLLIYSICFKPVACQSAPTMVEDLDESGSGRGDSSLEVRATITNAPRAPMVSLPVILLTILSLNVDSYDKLSQEV